MSATTLPLFDLDRVSKRRQRDELLRLLKDRRGHWVPLPDILDLGIAQYNARIFELRAQLGKDAIQSRTEWHKGKRLSWFRLV
jgi:hypothetical protein